MLPSLQAVEQLDSLSRLLLSALSRAPSLDMSPAALLTLLDHKPLPPNTTNSSILHASYYRKPQPAAAAGPEEASSSARAFSPTAPPHGCEAHHDRGLLTLISSSSVTGMEVQEEGSGSWLPVPLAPDLLLVLVGHSLTTATAGALPTCCHRVVRGVEKCKENRIDKEH